MIKRLEEKLRTQVNPISNLPPKALNSNEAFRNLKYIWRIIGMSPPSRFRIPYFAYSLYIVTLCAILFPLSCVSNVYFLDSLQMVLANLSLSLTFVIASCKTLSIFLYYGDLKKAENLLSTLDVRCDQNPTDRQYILSSIKLCHIIYIGYISFYLTIGVGLISLGYSKHQLIHDAWMPQLSSDPETNYLLGFFYQTMAQTYIIFQNVYNDIYPQSYIAMMIGHLRALAARIERIGKDASCSLDENQEELISCIQDHKNIQSYFQCISKVIALTIFLQFLVTAIILCLTAVNMMLFQSNFGEMVVTVMYLVAILGEVFPCCLLANLMMDETNRLTTAMYSCNWYAQDQKFRKTLTIFMQRSQLSNVIMAGNMASVSLQTFVAIIKFSFSLFTVLSKMKIE